MNPNHYFRTEGFTLVEMAIVLAIIALVLGTGLTLLSAQDDQRKIEDTNTLLGNAQEALIGYAIANGRLPCPASSTSNGVEDPINAATGVACTVPLNGYLPAVTLGLSNVDANGYFQDAWRLPQNRIRYAVTAANTRAATTTDGIKTTTMSTFSPDLHVCDSASGITATVCNTATTLTSNAVAVIYSLGANAAATAATSGAGIDEQANQNGDIVFVSHSVTYAKDAPANGAFDDKVAWISPYILFNRMVQAGKLP